MAESTKNKSSKPKYKNVASIVKEPPKIIKQEASQSQSQPQQEQSRSDDDKTTQYGEMSAIEDPMEFWNQWKLRKHKCMSVEGGQGRACNCFEGMGSVM